MSEKQPTEQARPVELRQPAVIFQQTRAEGCQANNAAAMGNKATDEEMTRVLNLPLINNQLPYTFSTGFTVPLILICCPCCGKTLSGENLRGTVNDSFKGMIIVENHGVCHECQMLIPLKVKFREDSTHQIWEQGQWREPTPEMPSMKQRFFRWLLRFCIPKR